MMAKKMQILIDTKVMEFKRTTLGCILTTNQTREISMVVISRRDRGI